MSSQPIIPARFLAVEINSGRRSREKGHMQPTNDLPFKVSFDEVRTERNKFDNTTVVKFTVKVVVNGVNIFEVPDLALINGRIQIPVIRKRIRGGEVHMKVFRPMYIFLKAIHDAIERSDWWTRFEKVPALIPVAPKDPEQDSDGGDYGDPTDDSAPRYRDPRSRRPDGST